MERNNTALILCAFLHFNHIIKINDKNLLGVAMTTKKLDFSEKQKMVQFLLGLGASMMRLLVSLAGGGGSLNR